MTEKNLAAIRRDYGNNDLSIENTHYSPFIQFRRWFDEIVSLATMDDPTAMVLSTVDKQGHPNSRVVLLKEITDDGFIFYTNYNSQKAKEIQACAYVALNFFWGVLARQVRVRGKIVKVSSEASDQYFLSRPLMSQLSAAVSPQSDVIASRTWLENALDTLMQNIPEGSASISRPATWGGYTVIPDEIEFWQGRTNRLHDRVRYTRLQNDTWKRELLAP